MEVVFPVGKKESAEKLARSDSEKIMKALNKAVEADNEIKSKTFVAKVNPPTLDVCIDVKIVKDEVKEAFFHYSTRLSKNVFRRHYFVQSFFKSTVKSPPQHPPTFLVPPKTLRRMLWYLICISVFTIYVTYFILTILRRL